MLAHGYGHLLASDATAALVKPRPLEEAVGMTPPLRQPGTAAAARLLFG